MKPRWVRILERDICWPRIMDQKYHGPDEICPSPFLDDEQRYMRWMYHYDWCGAGTKLECEFNLDLDAFFEAQK